MKLTREMIRAGVNPANAYTLAQLKLIGVPFEKGQWPREGWPERAVGNEIRESDYAEFLRLGKMTGREQRIDRKERASEKRNSGQNLLDL